MKGTGCDRAWDTERTSLRTRFRNNLRGGAEYVRRRRDAYRVEGERPPSRKRGQERSTFEIQVLRAVRLVRRTAPSSRLAVEAAPLSYKANSRRALAVVSLAMASTVSPLAAAIPSITSAT